MNIFTVLKAFTFFVDLLSGFLWRKFYPEDFLYDQYNIDPGLPGIICIHRKA
jgi:hypothetical protein